MKRLAIVIVWLTIFVAPSVLADAVDIYWIDVEGGASTLVGTETGESVLMDAGCTLNLITPQTRKEALDLVRAGVSVSLARDVEKVETADNPRPFEHEMLSAGMDRFAVSYHGFAHTHLDSLCHFAYEDRMYNGVSRETSTSEGSAVSGVERASSHAERAAW